MPVDAPAPVEDSVPVELPLPVEAAGLDSAGADEIKQVRLPERCAVQLLGRVPAATP